MGKKSKEHRKKVANRNLQLNREKESLNKMKERILMDIINKETQMGLLDDVPNSTESNINYDGPQI